MSNGYAMTGRVVKVCDTRTISDKFALRELWVDDGRDQYPQTVAFEFVNEKARLLDDIAEGNEVTVSFDLSGRIANDGNRCWTSLRGWKVEINDDLPCVDETPPESGEQEPAEVVDEIPF